MTTDPMQLTTHGSRHNLSPYWGRNSEDPPKPTMTQLDTLTTQQAAFVAGRDTRSIDRAVDRRLVRARRAGNRRVLGLPEAFFLSLPDEVTSLLSAEAKAALYARIREVLEQPRDLKLVSQPAIGCLKLDLREAVSAFRDRLGALAAAEKIVVEDPLVRSGEPVVRGTRIPVYMLHALAEQGASEDELLEDYPALDKARLEAALLYARTHPRRGRRPSRPAWHS
jgi:uncharacterized protein (DUF433 family)